MRIIMGKENLVRNNIILLLCLVFFILFYPVITVQTQLVGDILFSAIVLSGIYALDFRKRARIILLATGSATIILTWLSSFFGYNLLKLIDFLSLFLFNAFIIISMIRHMAESRHVTPVTIVSAINCYLLMGILGAVLLVMAEILNFYYFKVEPTLKIHDSIYFSFVTLTTLGYGDITPMSSIAKSVAVIISVSGQLYLAILVALLVGKFSGTGTR